MTRSFGDDSTLASGDGEDDRQGGLPVGAAIAGKYRITGRLGEGGMGTVYVARHAWTEREVAVKVLSSMRSLESRATQRFLREARAAAALKHPNVVDILDMGWDDHVGAFLVMERLEGESLGDHLARVGPLDGSATRTIMLPILDVLARAHRHGIIHRDLKPDNIFLANTATGIVPKLLDFGIAKVETGEGSGAPMTTPGTMMGTPAFMAPEQVRSAADVGPAADVWALGVILYECATGELPFAGRHISEILVAIGAAKYRRPSEHPTVRVDAGISRAIESALVVDLALRCPSVDALRALLEAPVSPPGVVPGATSKPPTRPLRNLASVVAGALAVTALWAFGRSYVAPREPVSGDAGPTGAAAAPKADLTRAPTSGAEAGEPSPGGAPETAPSPQPFTYNVTLHSDIQSTEYERLIFRTVDVATGDVIDETSYSSDPVRFPMTIQLVDRDPRQGRVEVSLVNAMGETLAIEERHEPTVDSDTPWLDIYLVRKPPPKARKRAARRPRRVTTATGK